LLEEFLDNYFSLIKKVNKFHLDYLTTNHFKFPKNDYVELKRFIDTAANFLSDIDDTILSKLAGKLYQDVNSLYEFYNEFSKKTKYADFIFYEEYLVNLKIYIELKKRVRELEQDKAKYSSLMQTTELQLKTLTENDPLYKPTKKNYVDAIYNLSKAEEEHSKAKSEMIEIEKREKERFFPAFKEIREKELATLHTIINVKLFYFDKLLWFNASNSSLIQKFFYESNIEGDFSTKTFIKYFLKNIDESKTSNSEWLNYLQKMLKVIE